MNQKRRAVTIGAGGTLCYYAVAVGLAAIFEHFKSGVGLMIAFVMFMLMFPSMIPGGLVSVLLALLGVRGFGGFHEMGFTLCPVICAPFVNAYVVYRWLRHKATAAM